ncbi:GDSL-type esterase/lipase family protein [Paraconexibacter antarcticus]|uniref:GDSL-type esterase/lipase family protein n=1 Tax=Paraconexibacter antarcticus TaxID=2949664 RepID=A0ABY5DN71_9ACTN|nr:GDSL-type esterase/lipase family protein [Paraconexibacter antarcticus]UTI62369.1 GDSL-type esterase/lipase family protein [Paraconexibacter antarcticus]
MGGRRTRALGALAAIVAGGAVATVLAPPSAAQAPAATSGFLVASRNETGYVALGIFGQTPGSTARFFEREGTGEAALGAPVTVDSRGFAPLSRAVTWRCDRPVRSFTATVTTPAGQVLTADTDIRTPSCRSRLAVTAPRHVARGALVRVRVVDTWSLGGDPVRVCVSGAGLTHRCRTTALVAGRRGVRLRVRPPRDGEVRVAVALAGHRTVLTTASGTAKPRARTTGPVLLTTGDSTIEGIDSVLEDDFGSAARVRTESAPGTELSGFGGAGWTRRAASQVRRLHPRVTVLSLGANEGFGNALPDGRTVDCCGDEWVGELARRQRALMRTFLQHGRGRVVWILLPAARSAAKSAVIDAADRGVIAAAKGLPGVHLVDLRPLFSPDGRFHQTIESGGRTVDVRAPDGVHLSAAGQALAAEAVRSLIVREGLLDTP